MIPGMWLVSKLRKIEIHWSPFVLVVISAVLSLVLGLFILTPEQKYGLFLDYGYWGVGLSLVLAVAFGIKPFLRSVRQLSFCRSDYVALAGLFSLFGVLFFMEENEFKVIMDETLLLGTSKVMAEQAEPLVPIGGYSVGEKYVYGGYKVDKRPILFPFVVSLVHQLRGFSVRNPMMLNNVVSIVLILMLYVFIRQYAKLMPSFVACLLFLTVPEFWMIGNGGGLGPMNLLVILMVGYLGGVYLSKPSRGSLNAFIFSGVLLSFVRPETVVLIGAVLLVVFIGAYQSKRIHLSWWAVLPPLLTGFYLLQLSVYERNPKLWQHVDLQKQSLLGLDYLVSNLGQNLKYFFNLGVESSNSLSLSIVGAFALLITGYLLFSKRTHFRGNPFLYSCCVFLGLLLVEMVFYQFYYEGDFMNPLSSRYTLPFLLFICMLIAYLLEYHLSGKVWVYALVLCPLFVEWSFINFTAFIGQKRFNYASLENWKNDFAEAHSDEKFIVLGDRYPLIWVLNKQSGVPVSAVNRYMERLSFLQKIGYFDSVYYLRRDYYEVDESQHQERGSMLDKLELEAFEDGVYQGQQTLYKVVNIKLPPPADMPTEPVSWKSMDTLEDEVLKLRIMQSFPLWN